MPHILNLSNLTQVKSIKKRIVQTPRVLQWSRTAILQQESPSHHGTEKTDCSVEESERELVVPLKPRKFIDAFYVGVLRTRCSAAYCLRTQNGQQKCRFGYPKQLQPETTIVTADTEPELSTARNDGLINSFNPVQVSAWRANLDMQYCLSRHRVVEYCAKYATKSEPRSQPLKEVFTNIVRSLKDDNTSLKAVQKLLINSVGERDYSAQETCHLLLQLPMFRASRDFIMLCLDGSRAVEDRWGQERSRDEQSPQ